MPRAQCLTNETFIITNNLSNDTAIRIVELQNYEHNEQLMLIPHSGEAKKCFG